MAELTNDSWLASVERWLWQGELHESSPIVRHAWHGARVAFAVVRDIVEGHLTLYAMSLVYTTLLSIVPFLALSFSVLKGFGVHNKLEPALESVLVAPLGEEKGTMVVENVLSFVDNIQVGVLGSVGLALLIYTVVSLVQKIEFSFNEIWHIGRSRSIGQRFSNYLSVIVIGPVLVFSALGATAAVVNTDLAQRLADVPQLEWLFALLGRLFPYLAIIGLFTFLYTFIPNTKVKLRYALAGGIVAGIIWQSAGFAFTIFAAGSTRYDAIYSGFAVGIMVLIWLYIAWLTLLVGASVAYYAQHSRQISRTRLATPSASLDEYAGLAIVYVVAKRFDTQGGGSSMTELESTLPVSAETLRRMVGKLVKHDILLFTGSDNDGLIPAQSLDRISLRQLIQVVRSPEDPLSLSLQLLAPVTNIVRDVESVLDQALSDKTVIDWVREDGADVVNQLRDDELQQDRPHDHKLEGADGRRGQPLGGKPEGE